MVNNFNCFNCLGRFKAYFGSWQIKKEPLKTQAAQSKAGELAKELFALGYPLNDKNKPVLNAYFRNSVHVISNMALALNEYAKNGNLEAKINPSMSKAQGGTLQPHTVKATFQAALNAKEDGGMQQTIAAIKEAHENPESSNVYTPEHYKVLQVCEKICSFVKEEILIEKR